MLNNYFHKRNMSISDKILSFDYTLLFLVLLLGVISMFAMYSSERGVFSYHSQNHLYRLVIFLSLFILVSFLKIEYIYKSAYIFYFIILLYQKLFL